MTTKTMKTVLLGCAAAIALAALPGHRGRRSPADRIRRDAGHVAKQAYQGPAGHAGPGNVRFRQAAVARLRSDPLLERHAPAGLRRDRRRRPALVRQPHVAASRSPADQHDHRHRGRRRQPARPQPRRQRPISPTPARIRATSRPSIDYTGPLSGLLDMIGSKFGVSWEYRGGVVRVLTSTPRSFTLVAPADREHLHNDVIKHHQQHRRRLRLGGGSSQSDQQAHRRRASPPRPSSTTGTRSRRMSKTCCPAGTRLTVSPESGSITVTARAPILDRVAQYVKDAERAHEPAGRPVRTVLSIIQRRTGRHQPELNGAISDASTGIGLVFNVHRPRHRHDRHSGRRSCRCRALDGDRVSGSMPCSTPSAGTTTSASLPPAPITTMNNQPAPIQVSKVHDLHPVDQLRRDRMAAFRPASSRPISRPASP